MLSPIHTVCYKLYIKDLFGKTLNSDVKSAILLGYEKLRNTTGTDISTTPNSTIDSSSLSVGSLGSIGDVAENINPPGSTALMVRSKITLGLL